MLRVAGWRKLRRSERAGDRADGSHGPRGMRVEADIRIISIPRGNRNLLPSFLRQPLKKRRLLHDTCEFQLIDFYA